MYCDMRECSSGMRRRSTHLFSQRSPGDVGQEEQDSVSWGDAANRFKNSIQQPPSRSRRRGISGENTDSPPSKKMRECGSPTIGDSCVETKIFPGSKKRDAAAWLQKEDNYRISPSERSRTQRTRTVLLGW